MCSMPTASVRHRQADRGRRRTAGRHGHLGRGQGAGQDARHPSDRPDVGNVPLLRTDRTATSSPTPTGFAQIITGVGADGIPNTADDIVISGTSAAPVGVFHRASASTHAFLADIAHDAVPNGIADGDIEIGLLNPGNNPAVYDNELLDAHFIAGDGRANENIGLTAVHHVFHSEHNRLVEHTKEVVLATKDLAFINEWLDVDLTPGPGQCRADRRGGIHAGNTLIWDGERLFQAAKFGTEMQYQHLVFEEFARKVQPNIDVFVVPDGYDADIDPAIVAEFAHVVYRFGHSMLTETIDRLDPTLHQRPDRPDRGLPQSARVRRSRPTPSPTASPPAPSSAA